MTNVKRCAVNVDLDEIHHYYFIHGNVPPPGSTTAVYDLAIPRLEAIASSRRLPLTFFAVGKDLQRAHAASALRRVAGNGHCVGNHSDSHLYDLTRRDRETIAKEIDDGATAIENACGVRPIGFRAPGYTITDEVFALLQALGVQYDSSVFPCPAYMAVKDAAIIAYRALGRPSRSVIDHPRVLSAPIEPYRVGKPYWTRGRGLVEFPIQVTRTLRLPFIGTSLMLAGPDLARRLTRAVLGASFVNLELHGIDLLDHTDQGLSQLAASQRDLRIPRARKEATLAAVIETLRSAGYSFVTLDEAARTFV
ncbi:MAG: hypothetical protein NVS3B20_17950 [Polyangiales bacterium]